MIKTELEVKKAFADAMFSYSANQLKNNVGFEPFEDLQLRGYAVVDIRFDGGGNLKITKAETYEKDLASMRESLEDAKTELREAKKTISQQEKQIKSLKEKQAKPTEKITKKKTKKLKEDLTIDRITFVSDVDPCVLTGSVTPDEDH